MKALLGIPSLLYKLYVGVVFVSTLLLLYPFFLIILSRKSWRKYSFPLNVFWSHLVRILMLVFVRKLSSPKIPDGPYMIIANHASYFDIFIMYSLLPNHRFLFLGKSEILSYPLVKTYFKRLNIPVHRSDRRKAAQSFMQARQAIQEGWSLVVFPEGGIPDEDHPTMIPFKEGAFKLAKSAGIPIVPITFIDNYHLFSDPGDLLGPAHPGISRVIIHPIIDQEEVMRLSERELLEKTFRIVSEPLVERGLMKRK
ncbi:MAG: 1-acyl-sn-glycerol-3-phosphate acyltransferase [Fluviicola sp.]|nr:1-acyl-sn-glycerol-3-phosphate acyltransferase [Fluviicola sp.]